MALRTMKIAVTTMNIKIKHKNIKKIEHNPNQNKSIKKIKKIGQQRNNTYLGAAEKMKEKAHSRTEKKPPERRGRRRCRPHSRTKERRGTEEAHRISMGLMG